MVGPTVALRLFAAAFVVAGVALAGGAMAAPGDVPSGTATKAVAETVSSDREPSCVRKVKVVYAGYGEADRACSVSAKAGD